MAEGPSLVVICAYTLTSDRTSDNKWSKRDNAWNSTDRKKNKKSAHLTIAGRCTPTN